MATFLDVTGLQHFTNIFVFLFVWILIYAIMNVVKVFGDNKVVAALVGFLFGVFTLISPTATAVIAGVAPFIAILFVFAIMLSIGSKVLGNEAEGFSTVRNVMLIFVILIVVIAAAIKLRESINLDSKSQLSSTMRVVFSPTFLGLVLLFSIAVFTVALLASKG